jgi:predicted HTH domain antitoxin
MDGAEQLAKIEQVDKSVILREALEKGLEDIKLDTAVEHYAKGKVSTSEAAEIAGISVGEMMDELVTRGIKSRITLEDVKQSLENAGKLF